MPEHQPDATPFSASTEEGTAFDALLADAQPRIRGYLASILGGWADVDDLLQETNLVLIRKRDDFQPGSSFVAWAFRVAYFKATTWRRDRSREGRVVLREHEFQEIAAAAEDYFSQAMPVVQALKQCVAKLPPNDRDLIRLKYVDRQSLTDVAAGLGCRPNTLHKSISRIRLALRKCVGETMDR